MREITEQQSEVYAWIVAETRRTGKPTTVNAIASALSIHPWSAYDRAYALARRGLVYIYTKGRRRFFVPADGKDYGMNHYEKKEYKNPITPAEIDGIKGRMQYRQKKKPGTKVKYLWRDEMDKVTGLKVRKIREIEAVEPYRHGVLFVGKRIRTFVTWADLALYYRHGMKKPVGSNYGRDEK